MSSIALCESGAAVAGPALRERITGVDFGRFVAVVAVVFIHARDGAPIASPLEMAARFAVPFFFVVAGFFFSHGSDSFWRAAVKVLLRLLVPFAFWILVYLMWFRPGPEAFSSLKFWAKLFIEGGPAYHLWFLLSLSLCSILLLALLRLRASLAVLAGSAIALYGIGLAFGAYYGLLLRTDDVFFWNTRNGPFFGLPFMVVGYLIAKTRWRPGLAVSGLIFVLGGLVHLGEALMLQRLGYSSAQDQLVGTAAYGVGFFLLVRHLPDWPAVACGARLGRYSLGIYATHLLILLMLVELGRAGYFLDSGTNLGELTLVASVAILSTLVAVAMGRYPLLRRLVR